jgi:Tfp pilus assembly protein PilN
MLLVTLLVIVASFGGGVYLTREERGLAEQELSAGEQSVARYGKVKKEAEDFSANLTIAKSILSQEVLYSDMIVQIARTLPGSAVLSSLRLDQATLQKPIVLAARVRTKDDAVTLKNTLEESPLFEKVNLNSINEQPITPATAGIARTYPVVVALSMNVTKGQPGSLMP